MCITHRAFRSIGPASICLDGPAWSATSQPSSVASFLEHVGRIDIVAPAGYRTDAGGYVSGTPEPKILEAAQLQGVLVLPLVSNPSFDPRIIHAIVRSAEARERLIRLLLAQCREQRYWGMQFDFENVPPEDRDLFTALIRQAAKAFHAEGFQLSLAMYPNPPGKPAGYDLGALAREVDFITLMTYDQHTLRTGPGPIGGYPWMESALDDAIKEAPPEKLSLGIPLYGGRWSRGFNHISGPQALALAAQQQALIRWDEMERSHWFFFDRGGVRETVHFTDSRSFAERLRMARTHGVHSISAWVLGMEEPAIWKLLPKRVQP